jgi:hypothetical protein
VILAQPRKLERHKASAEGKAEAAVGYEADAAADALRRLWKNPVGSRPDPARLRWRAVALWRATLASGSRRVEPVTGRPKRAKASRCLRSSGWWSASAPL